MNIKSLTIMGMHNVDCVTYDFMNMVYLNGRNGAGKSTIIQAIQLGILGYIPGTNKTNAAIFKHCNGKHMSVQITFDNGVKILRQWDAAGKEVKASVITEPENLDIMSILDKATLPVCSYNEFISMTSNKLKDWFIAFLPKSSQELDWKKELRTVAPAVDMVSPDMLTEAANVLSTDDLVDSIRNFNQLCKDNISVLKGDIIRLENTIQSLVYYDDFDFTLDESQILEEIRNLEIQRDSISSRISGVQANDRIKEKLSHLTISDKSPDLESNVKYTELLNKHKELKEIEETNSTYVSQLKSEIDAMYSEIDRKEYIISGGGICTFTNSVCDSISKQIASLKSEVCDLKGKIQIKSDERNAITTKLSVTRANIEATNREIAFIKNEYAAYEALHSQVDPGLDGISVADLEAEKIHLRDKITDLRNNLVKIQANKKYDSLSETLHKEKRLSEAKLEIYKAWDKLSGVNGIQSKVMSAPFEQFESDMSTTISKLFDDNSQAKFVVGEKANSFSFGLMRDGQYIDFDMLSSGEKCLYALALLITINRYSPSDFKLVLIDDLFDHLDDTVIRNCFTTLYNITDLQMIIAGVKSSDIPIFDKFTIRIGDQ